MNLPYQRIKVIINPAAGHNEPILNVLNDVFHPTRIDWQVALTYGPGDAARIAKEAAEEGFDLVAAYGGDGTQMEVANGLSGTNVPQAILPGGTGNAMALELGVPINLKQATELIINNPKKRSVDVARMDDNHGGRIFMLRAYTGVSTKDAASRELKDKFGQLAYVQASLKFLFEAPANHYKVVIDGEEIEGEAMICFILNAGSIGGVLGFKLPTDQMVDVSDGLLDFYAITKGVKPLRALSQFLYNHEGRETGLYHWKGSKIQIEADPEQDFWVDGEMGGTTPISISAIPSAIQILSPGN